MKEIAKDLITENPELIENFDKNCDWFTAYFVLVVLIDVVLIFHDCFAPAVETALILENGLGEEVINEIPPFEKNIERYHKLEEINHEGIGYLERRSWMRYLEKYHPTLYRLLLYFFSWFIFILNYRISFNNYLTGHNDVLISFNDVLSLTYSNRIKYISYAIPFSFLVFLWNIGDEWIMRRWNLRRRFHPWALLFHQRFMRLPNLLFAPFGWNLPYQRRRIFEYILELMRRFRR